MSTLAKRAKLQFINIKHRKTNICNVSILNYLVKPRKFLRTNIHQQQFVYKLYTRLPRPLVACPTDFRDVRILLFCFRERDRVRQKSNELILTSKLYRKHYHLPTIPHRRFWTLDPMALYKVVFTKMYYTSPSPSFGNMAILLRPPRSFKLFPRPLADLQNAGRRANRMHISVNDHWPRCKEDDSSIILLPSTYLSLG